MKLKRLEKTDLARLKDKKIYCYERSGAYLSELNAEFPELAKNLTGIIDENRRSQGEFLFAGKAIPVKSLRQTGGIDGTEAALVITSDYYREAFERIEGDPDSRGFPDIVYYFANRETSIEESYREKYKGHSLENIILFRSGPHASSYIKGMDFSDNARALFEYMLREGFSKRYELVWLVKNPEEFARYKDREKVTFLSFDWSVSEDRAERDSYYRALCLAKYIFFTDAYGFARNCRPDQTRVQLWHGCGFKTRVNFVRCEKRYEYTTVISDLYSRIHQDIYGLRENQVLVSGYAKQDWLFCPAWDKWGSLGMPRASRYVFWLPTFRRAKAGLTELNEHGPGGQTGLPVADTYEKLEKLDRLLRSLDTALVLKLHPFQDPGSIRLAEATNIALLDNGALAANDIQVNQILGIADGLVSDYSSAAVDYMLLDRPIGFTLEDVEEYGNSRGFVFENIREWLPGAEIFDFRDFCAFVEGVGKGEDPTAEKRRELLGKMHKYRDGQNCKRIVEMLQI